MDEFTFISYGEGLILVLRNDEVVFNDKLSEIKILNTMFVKRDLDKSIDFVLANGKPVLLSFRAIIEDGKFEVVKMCENFI